MLFNINTRRSFNYAVLSDICDDWHFTPCVKDLQDCTISLRGQILTPPLVVEVPVPSQESSH